MLLCDGCDDGFHMHCLDPALQSIPEGDWYCNECEVMQQLCCQVCASPERGDEMILCDQCDLGWHLTCVSPPLASIPEHDWSLSPPPPFWRPLVVLSPYSCMRALAHRDECVIRCISNGVWCGVQRLQ